MEQPTPEDFLAGAKSNGLGNELVTEDQAAIEFARLYADRLRFDHDAGKWREWTGAIWKENRKNLAFHFARELARDLSASEPDRVRYVSAKVAFANGVERFARADPTFAVDANYWNKDPWLLGTPGGTVDLKTGRLFAARPDDAISRSTAVTPADTADYPIFLKFLATAGSIFGARPLVRRCGPW
jgi:putative DNA primase/helicase